MNDEQMKEIFAEILHIQAESTALLIAAVSRQLDAGLLHAHLQQVIGAGNKLRTVSPAVLRQATLVLAAVEAEIQLRKMDGSPTAH